MPLFQFSRQRCVCFQVTHDDNLWAPNYWTLCPVFHSSHMLFNGFSPIIMTTDFVFNWVLHLSLKSKMGYIITHQYRGKVYHGC